MNTTQLQQNIGNIMQYKRHVTKSNVSLTTLYKISESRHMLYTGEKK